MRFEISAATRAGTTSISAPTAAGGFELLDVLDRPCIAEAAGFADRLEAPGPGRSGRNETHMADDRNFL